MASRKKNQQKKETPKCIRSSIIYTRFYFLNCNNNKMSKAHFIALSHMALGSEGLDKKSNSNQNVLILYREVKCNLQSKSSHNALPSHQKM